MTNLAEAITWEHYPIGAGAATRQVQLSVGTVRGTGQAGDGPITLISAGVHGDEGPWGALAIHLLLRSVPLTALRGTLRIVPAANPLAMEADARNAPLDVLDLNRSFPGNAGGSHTERLAAAIAEHAVTGAGTVIDIHGGGSWCVNAFVFQWPGGEHLAQAMGAPFVVTGPDRAVTLTGHARTTANAAVVGIEMGGRSQFEGDWAGRIAAGLRRGLATAGILDLPEARAERVAPPVPVKPSTVLRPIQGGIFVPTVRADVVGTIVPGGTVLGHLLDPVTYAEVEVFRAPFTQTAVMLLRPMIARLEGGAMTYGVSEPA